MKNIRQYNGSIVSLDRMPSSSNGNPRYMVEFKVEGRETTIHFCTAVDSPLGSEITNYFKPDVRCCVEVGMHYNKPTLHSIVSYN